MARKKKKRKNGFYFDYSLLFVLIFIKISFSIHFEA